MQPTELAITHSEQDHRFEGRLADQSGLAVAEYYLTGDSVIITHTQVPPEWGGRGIGSKLVRHTLDEMETWGKTVVPACSFVGSYIQQHPEYEPLTKSR